MANVPDFQRFGILMKEKSEWRVGDSMGWGSRMTASIAVLSGRCMWTRDVLRVGTAYV
jgi:hypothetical protein